MQIASGFVTSRGSRGNGLPTNEAEMAQALWANVWERRLWPYQEIQEGDTLYWYDAMEKAIVWKSRLHKIKRFQFASKDEMRSRLISLGENDFDDPYFADKPDEGYGIAYKVDSIVRLNVPKPAEYRFPHSGWLRCSDESARDWLMTLPPAEAPDDPTSASPTDQPVPTPARTPVLREGGAGFGVAEQNTLVETAAIEAVRSWYKQRAWSVVSKERDRCGFDLECTKDSKVEHAEVKGVSGESLAFIITAREVKQARTDRSFVLWVARRALSPTPKLNRYSGQQFLSLFELEPISYWAILDHSNAGRSE